MGADGSMLSEYDILRLYPEDVFYRCRQGLQGQSGSRKVRDGAHSGVMREGTGVG
jgi:hypothetical protein